MDPKDGKTKGMFHKRLREHENFDSIEMKVVPRYKTSGLSGDEWRQCVHVRLAFKGVTVSEYTARDMETAALLLGCHIITDMVPDPVIKLEDEGACDQPSCCEMAIARYQLREQYGRQGERLHPEDAKRLTYRQFCRKHLRRGDCGLEDADRNYIPLDGIGPEDAGFVIESPAAFGGVVVVDGKA